MLDPYMSNMLILAVESDILDSIKNYSIIDRFACISSIYSKLSFLK